MSKKKLSLNIGEKDEVTAQSGFLDMSQGPLVILDSNATAPRSGMLDLSQDPRILERSYEGANSSGRYIYTYLHTSTGPGGGCTKYYDIYDSGTNTHTTGSCADSIFP